MLRSTARSGPAFRWELLLGGDVRSAFGQTVLNFQSVKEQDQKQNIIYINILVYNTITYKTYRTLQNHELNLKTGLEGQKMSS